MKSFGYAAQDKSPQLTPLALIRSSQTTSIHAGKNVPEKLQLLA